MPLPSPPVITPPHPQVIALARAIARAMARVDHAREDAQAGSGG